VMLGLLLVIRSLISMTLDALQHFSDAGLPLFLLVPGIGTDPDGRWLRLRHVRSPECVAPIFYRILLWRIKLGKSLTSSSVFVGAKRAPHLPLEWRERAPLSASAVPSGEHRWHWYCCNP